jgi:UDP-2,3-diacylglucosamine pyrophosphatase LpxH
MSQIGETNHGDYPANLADQPDDKPPLPSEGSEPSNPAEPVERCRTIFISDLHLGTRAFCPEPLLDFLNTHEANTIYLVGDIVDTWYPMGRRWKVNDHAVIQKLLEKSRNGCQLIMIPGNHDALFRLFDGADIGQIEIRQEDEYQTADGNRYLITHGDQCDTFCDRTPFLAALGSLSEGIALALDDLQKGLLARFGRSKWGGIDWAIQKVKDMTRKHDRFELRLVALAADRKLDGIICGHFHLPDLRPVDGRTYANCGDWVGSNTAIIEQMDGSLKLWAAAAH